MKAKLHYPTEQFGFAEVEVEVESLEDAIEIYNASKSSKMASEGGLDTKEWNRVVDKYLSVQTMASNESERMNKAQKWFIHEIDKSFNRLNPPTEPRVRTELTK